MMNTNMCWPTQVQVSIAAMRCPLCTPGERPGTEPAGTIDKGGTKGGGTFSGPTTPSFVLSQPKRPPSLVLSVCSTTGLEKQSLHGVS